MHKFIQITQIETPHKFWFKFCDDSEKVKLDQLSANLNRYVEEKSRLNQQTLANKGDVIVAFHQDWKWFRGKAGRISEENGTFMIELWAIDYGCILKLPLEDVYSLEEACLAYLSPINVHIGGLSDIVAAKLEFNTGTLDVEKVQCKQWTPNAIELFEDWNVRPFAFEPNDFEGSRHFGQLFVCDDNTNILFNVNEQLCTENHAHALRNFRNAVPVLTQDDFMRLNHELTLPCNDDTDTIELSTEDANIYDDNSEISSQGMPALIQEPSLSGSHNTASLSSISVTLSVRSLNGRRLIAITDEDVVPVKQWTDLAFFTPKMVDKLKQLCKGKMNSLCSYGWPNMMRGNSLFLIGDFVSNMVLCLPAICSIAHSNKQPNELSDGPVVIILVNGTKPAEQVASFCRKLVKSAEMTDLVVQSLDSSFKMTAPMTHCDILITSVFLLTKLLLQRPKLLNSQRLKHVWVCGIDEMHDNKASETCYATEVLCTQNRDLQITVTSETCCPIFQDFFNKTPDSMFLVGEQSPTEAALFANCRSIAKFMTASSKIDSLIEKIRYDNSLNGSIVIICATANDAKFVTGSLTRSNIKCINFGSSFSENQMRLVTWAQSTDVRSILVCVDSDLNSFPIRTAQHIIHYSLPEKLDTFVQRYVMCFGYSDKKLRHDYFKKANQPKLDASISLVYFDDNIVRDVIQIHEFLKDRMQCSVPEYLTDTIKMLCATVEEAKVNRTLCSKMIITSKSCDSKCPYRHTVTATENDDAPLIRHGFVNMQLLDTFSANHFSVYVTSQKRRLNHKSEPVNSFRKERQEFAKLLNAAHTSRRKPASTEIDNIYLVKYMNTLERCRVISKSKNKVEVFLIDVGVKRQFAEQELFHMDEEFEKFPSRAVEVFVLGYVPRDNNPEWLPEANKLIQWMKNYLKKECGTDVFLQAEVLRSYGRTLIVKDLKLCCIVQKQYRIEWFGKKLMDNGLAEMVPIKFHRNLSKKQRNLSSEIASTVSTEDSDNVLLKPSISYSIDESNSENADEQMEYKRNKSDSRSVLGSSNDEQNMLEIDKQNGKRSTEKALSTSECASTNSFNKSRIFKYMRLDGQNSVQSENMLSNYDEQKSIGDTSDELLRTEQWNLPAKKSATTISEMSTSTKNDLIPGSVQGDDLDGITGNSSDRCQHQTISMINSAKTEQMWNSKEDQSNNNLISFESEKRADTQSILDLDDIFGSLPDAIQAIDVLVPNKIQQSNASNEQVTSIDTNLLIDFSD